MNVSAPPVWRLKLVNSDESGATDRRFHDLRSLLSAAALLRAERPDVRLIVTVPKDASAEDRGLIEQIASRVLQDPD